MVLLRDLPGYRTSRFKLDPVVLKVLHHTRGCLLIVNLVGKFYGGLVNTSGAGLPKIKLPTRFGSSSKRNQFAYIVKRLLWRETHTCIESIKFEFFMRHYSNPVQVNLRGFPKSKSDLPFVTYIFPQSQSNWKPILLRLNIHPLAQSIYRYVNTFLP